MTKKLFLLLACVMMFLACVPFSFAAEIGGTLTSEEVTILLTHKTFSVKHFKAQTRGQVLEKDSHAYFGPDGSIQVNYSARHTKSGRWTVGGNGELCFRYTERGGSKSLRVTRCGTLVKRGPFTFDRINDQGVRTATLTLVANGNKFPLR